MAKKGYRRLSVLLVLVLSLTMVLAGCGTGTGGNAASQELNLNINTEPPALTPTLATDTTSGTVLTHVMEGLTRYGEGGKTIPGIAESWDVSDDGMKYVFHLRDAKWSDGQPVTAHDFEYAWKKLLDPNTAADYAYQLFYLKNGEAYNEGNASADDVGVKALDDKTLEVQLESPTPYFDSLTAFYPLFPIPKHVDETNPDWHKDAKTYVSNGPFLMEEWVHDSKIVLKKNPNYWAQNEVKLATITMAMVNDENTEYQMYETGALDVATPPTDLTKKLIDEGKAKVEPYFGVYYLTFNTEDPIMKNANIRRALSLAIDRQSLIDNILQGGQLPAMALVPPGAPGVKGDFREEQGDLFKDHDVEQAKKYLEAGLKELSLDKLPPIEYKYNTQAGHQKIAEAIQQMWKNDLGIETKLTNEEWKVYLDSLGQGNYQIGRMGWIGDYLDAMTFIDLFMTGGGNNYPKWSNAEYDALIKEAKSTNDHDTRIKKMQEAEKLLIDEMPIAPIYFYTTVYMEKPYVKGAWRNSFSSTDYSRAWIEGK
ncbi:MAG: Oligopeptide ABC transporter, periplasmic oligopeptide-binding protein OppA [Candidatus Carbobacillus altaicus]|uniref:Oligopeptide ABC transporter, periplasmic oligopeptide-binding protein OppA n=1 Tax=Candidatus Carbonibacillus altaicus TaxID=2163959 RepID=A0A2R6Y5K2_9BACL|nr:MAG: Oligopeptide ABC transporter, periplasmic oligopeptide-binding protein OppA [Candidatus Carbobacillus altaicus]